MHQPRPPFFTDHRRKRLSLWALTVLGWLAGVLFGERDANLRQVDQRFHHICLDQLTRTVIALLMSRALQFAKIRVPSRISFWRRGRNMRRAHFRRSLLGARLRRLLTHKDLKTRIAQLAALLRDLDTHARHLAQRLRKLRRLWRELPPIAPAALLLRVPAPSPAVSDSS